MYFIASSRRSQNIYSQNQCVTPTKNDVHEITLKTRQDNNRYIFMILRDLSMMLMDYSDTIDIHLKKCDMQILIWHEYC